MSTDTRKILAMRTGGRHLGAIRDALEHFTQVGMSFEEIEAEAQRQIRAVGATPSFSTVPGYSWATCIMRNDELCHGIPQNKRVAAGDLITIDVGLLWEGYHLDTTTTFGVGKVSSQVQEFIAVGKKSLAKAIAKVRAGESVYSISRAMEKVLDQHGFGAVYQLTGHGVGEELHMQPSIPVFAQKQDKRVLLKAGQTIAVEVMYSAGDPTLVLDSDNWTYRTKDGALSGMFEETVLVTPTGHEVLTRAE